MEMFVKKRNGEKVSLKLDKVQNRIKELAKDLNVNSDEIAIKAVDRMFDGIESREIDQHLASITVNNNIHYHYNILAGRIGVSSLHKETAIGTLLEGEKAKLLKIMKEKVLPKNNKLIIKLQKSFYKDKEREKILDSYLSGKKVSVKKLEFLTNAPRFFSVIERLFNEGLINERVFDMTKKYRKEIENKIDYNRDFMFDFFGFETLKGKYLLQVKESFQEENNGSTITKTKRTVLERPQDLFMRVALAIRSDDLEKAFELYDSMSHGYYTHATPTLFNAGTIKEQMSSCFLLSMKDDSIDGIYKTLDECAKISQSAGGIGLSIHNVRSKGSYIKGTGGISNGIVPMLKVFNETARYVDQCFVPDTKIVTNLGMKNIKDLSLGDIVVNQKGHFTEVEKVFKTDIRQYLNVLEVNTKVKVTDAHPMFSIKSKDLAEARKKIEANFEAPEYRSVSDLQTGDTIGFRVPNFEKDVGYSEDDCEFYGKLLKNGYISSDSRECVLIEKDGYELFTLNYLVENNVNFQIDRKNGMVEIKFNPSKGNMFKFNHELCFKNNEKRIHESFLFLPVKKIEVLINSLFSGEEYIKGNVNFQKDLMLIGLRAKKLLQTKDERIYSPEKSAETFFEYENFLFTSILNKEKEFYDGVVYDLKVKEEASYMTEIGLAHNGGGKRKGSFAMYLEPWHSDVQDFINLKKNNGAEEKRSRDLFTALWVPNLLGKRVKEGGKWSLFDPKEVPLLYDTYGDEFEKLYAQYEREGKAVKVLDAQEFFLDIMESEIETGVPYMVNKDECNKKSNQKNLGTIKSSNLCCEIVEYTSKDENAVCNLASVCLPKFVENGKFNFNKFHKYVQIIIENLDKVIDRNYYVDKRTKLSNTRHRPVGLGVQGLADVFFMLKLPYCSLKAQELNEAIFETMYHAAITKSLELAKKDGHYPSMKENGGAPISKGIFQFDMWDKKPSDKYDWDSLRKEVITHGIRNSLLVAPMPTASTSQIFYNFESFEPLTSNLYKRKVDGKEFIVVNKHMIKHFEELGIWNQKLINDLIINNGSIQNLDYISQDIKEIYKTVWELSLKKQIDMAADRGAFICQSQSFNVHMKDVSMKRMADFYMYSFEKGLKTMSYYFRTTAAIDNVKVTVNTNSRQVQDQEDDDCEACGS